MSRIPPNPPILAVRTATVVVAAIVVSAMAADCSVLMPPSVDGLLVATGGPLQVTDGSGDLVPFDGPTDPVIAVTASDGQVVVATAGGKVRTSSGSETPRVWKDVVIPVARGTGFPLMAVSPLGQKLALAVGELQGTTFDLVIVDVGLATSQSIRVERGLNGPPAWIGPGIVALNVIRADGESAIATIDIGSGAVTDGAIPGRVVSATIVGKLVAVDDPGSGDVLVGETGTVGTGPRDRVTRLVGPPRSGVDSLAISAAGGLLAVVRRTESGSASIEVYRAVDGVWKSVRTIQLPGDGPVSVAWLR
jgi:hypothetical protein